MLDLDELEARIAEGEKKNFFVAPLVKQLIAELREALRERAAVVAWLRESSDGLALLSPEGSATLRGAANEIERGDHRKGEP